MARASTLPEPPVLRLLYPQRKRVEMLVAIFAGGFGVYLLALQGNGGAPLRWAGLNHEESGWMALAIALGALVHALGVRINGRWRWSPVLRLLGMATHSWICGFLSWQGFGTSAGYPYACFAGLLIYGMFSAGVDMKRAGLRWKMH